MNMNIMDMMDRTQKGFERRLRTFQIVAMALLIVLVGRLWQLQVMRGDYFKSRSTANRIAVVPVSAPRGLMVDRNGEVLVTSRMAHTVSAMPQEFQDRQSEVELLSRLLGMTSEEIEARLKVKPRQVWRSISACSSLEDALPRISKSPSTEWTCPG